MSINCDLVQCIFHQHVWSHFIFVLFQQSKRIPHLCYEVSCSHNLCGGAGDVQAIIPFPISLTYLQGSSLQQPLNCIVLPIVASSVKGGVPISIFGLSHQIGTGYEVLKGFDISVGSCSDKWCIPVKIAAINSGISNQSFCSLFLPHKNSNHQGCISFLVSFAEIKLIVVLLNEGQADLFFSFGEGKDEETLLMIKIGA